MDAVLAPLIESPQLVRYVEELQQLLAAERVKRERFYEDISPEDKWEFINGTVVMHSPVSVQHARVRARIERLLAAYLDGRSLGEVNGEKLLVSFTRNDYEPDIVYFSHEVAETLQPEQWKCPVPSMIVEVLSHSTERTDRTTKAKDYASHGVLEYWIVDPDAESIEQYLEEESTYHLATKQADGTFACRAIRGLTMPIRAAFDDEANRVARRSFAAAS